MILNQTRIILHLGSLVLLSGFLAGCQKGGEKILEGMAHIPAGEFIMGSNQVDTEMLQQRFGMRDIPYQNENPERKAQLDDYYLDKYEVTNKQYKEYLDYAWRKLSMSVYSSLLPAHWKDGNYAQGKDEFPVTSITWKNAQDYCQWKGKRLPTEAEWEKAARGPKGRKYPWGDTFDAKKANAMGHHGGTAAVGTFKEDVSVYGVYDMAGNVSEWTNDWYQRYPGNKFDSDAYGEKFKVTRGWYWGGVGHYTLESFYDNAHRNYVAPNKTFKILGFRCAYSK